MSEQEAKTRAAARRALRPSIIDPDQFYCIDETAAARDQSRAALYADIKLGRIRITKRGSRTTIAGSEIIRANRSEAGV